MENYTKEQYQEIVNNCTCKADFCRALGYSPIGGYYKMVDKIIKDNNLDTSHFIIKPWNKGKKYKIGRYSLEEILIENSTRSNNTNSLKRRLINAGLKEPKCELCGYTDAIELHHINGDHFDNRIENLQILCPNCHAKTDTFRGKNNIKYPVNFRITTNTILTEEEAYRRDLERLAKRRGYKTIEEYENRKKRIVKQKEPVICPICGKSFMQNHREKYCSVECYRSDSSLKTRPSAIQLIEDLKECRSFLQIGKKYNVSDNAVRKWCKLYMLPTNVIELNAFLESQNIVPIMKNRKISSYNKGETNSSYGTKWMNNGIDQKKVKVEDIQNWLDNNWVFGKLK